MKYSTIIRMIIINHHFALPNCLFLTLKCVHTTTQKVQKQKHKGVEIGEIELDGVVARDEIDGNKRGVLGSKSGLTQSQCITKALLKITC